MEFKESFPYIIFFILFIFLTIYYSMVFIRNSTNRIICIISYLLRLLIIVSLTIFFIEPTWIIINSEKIIKSTPCYIDISQSMEDGVTDKESAFSGSHIESVKNIIKKHFLDNESFTDNARLSLLAVNNEINRINKIENIKTDKNSFNLKNIIDSINDSNYSYEKAIICSDWMNNYPINDIAKINKPIYIVMPSLIEEDVAILNVITKTGNKSNNYILDISIRSSEGILNRPIQISLKQKDKVVSKNVYTFNKSISSIKVDLENLISGVIETNVEIIDFDEVNISNNTYYTNVFVEEDQKKITVYVFFGNVGYESSFLIQYLSRRQDINHQFSYIKPDNPKFKFPAIEKGDIIILANFLEGHTDNTFISKTSNFVSSGGLLIFYFENTFINSVINSKWNELLPFSNYEKKNNENESDHSHKLKVTKSGYEFSFLTFKDRFITDETWDSLPIFSSNDYKVKVKASAKLLATINNETAICYEKKSSGKIFTLTLSPLWKIDFTSLSVGKITNYYDLFWEELLNQNINLEIKDAIAKPLQNVYEYDEKVTILFSPDTLEKYLPEIEISNDKENITVKIEKNEDTGVLYCTFPCFQLGKNSVFLTQNRNKEKTLACTFYKNYPVKELNYIPLSERMDLIDKLVKASNGAIIYQKDFAQIQKYFPPETEISKNIQEFSITHQLYFLLIISVLFIMDWIVRKFFWR